MNGVNFLLHFLYITFLFCCIVQSSGVISDSNEGEEATLDIQPTVLPQSNISDNAKAETNLNPSEGNLVPDTPPNSDVVNIDYTDVLEQVPEAVFSQVGSDDAKVNELINNDTPIVISRIDSATEELQKRANILSPLSSEETPNTTNAALDDIEDDRSDTNTTLETEKEIIPNNATDKTAEDIPSFSEWAQKHLEEAEKKEQVNFSTPAASSNTTKHGVGAKLHWKNYAAVECGAKVIQANPEAEHTWAILVGARDEYILNPCNSRIWFIVELCEAIQLKKIDLANYELFSSSPKDFTVSVSDRFPTRDWFVVGQFTASDERGVQNFEVNTETFGKYVKVEVKTHYGSEHYCPLSLFRAYGMSVFEVLQKDDPAHEQPLEDEDDDPLDDCLKEPSGNLLSSATDAVLSMVKKAAQVLGNKVNKTNETSQTSSESKSESPLMKSCSSPSHYVVCNNCSDVLFGKVFELLSCRREHMRNLVSIPYIKTALEASTVCEGFGFDFRDKRATVTANSASMCIESFFPASFLGAMCNILAIAHDKISYNVSHQFATSSSNVTRDGLDSEPDEAKTEPIINETESETDQFQHTEPLNLDGPMINSKSGCSTDTSYTSQIKPSKLLTKQLPIYSELNTESSFNGNELNESAENVEQPKTEDVQRADPTVIDTSAEIAESDLAADHVESVEKLMTELNTETSAPAATSGTPTSAGNLQGQKESVFLRLSNRIKALERNMSLSSQYLEELSKRYKKQIEEMQRVLDKTERALNEATTIERERYNRLEDKFEVLTKTLETLKADENNWKSTSFCLFFFISCTFLAYFFNRLATSKPGKSSSGKPTEVQRRNSVDVVTRVATKKKKRRPSDQALKIVASAASGDQEKISKKRKKKISNSDSCKIDCSENTFAPLCASSKIWTKPNPDWVESRGSIIEDIPFPLEEPDSCTVKFSPVLSDPKTIIEAPGFMKTAANFRLGRASLKNGSVKKLESKNRQPSPVPSTNGSLSSVTEQTPKKDKKLFRKLLKKVF